MPHNSLLTTPLNNPWIIKYQIIGWLWAAKVDFDLHICLTLGMHIEKILLIIGLGAFLSPHNSPMTTPFILIASLALKVFDKKYHNMYCSFNNCISVFDFMSLWLLAISRMKGLDLLNTNPLENDWPRLRRSYRLRYFMVAFVLTAVLWIGRRYLLPK